MPPPTPLTSLLWNCQNGAAMADVLLGLEAQARRLRLPPPPVDPTRSPAERRDAIASLLQAELDDFQAQMERAFAQHGSYPIGDSCVHRVAFAIPEWYHQAAATLQASSLRGRPWGRKKV